ncbi:MAG: class I SAM-dependent methyltransferase [Thermoplasmata archaeon]
MAARRAGPGRGVLFVRAGADHLPFRSASFSAVLLIRVYHRFRDPSSVLAEMTRVLKPGGRLALALVPHRA